MSDTSSEPYNPPTRPLRDESNFYRWKSEITRHLRYLKLFDIVRGTAPRPATPPSSPRTSASASASAPAPESTAEQDQWDVSSAYAVSFIYNRVAPDIQATMPPSYTAPEVWEMLMQRYHRRDTRTLLCSLDAIRALRLEEGESISEHLAAFRGAWFDLLVRTGDAPAAAAGVPPSMETALGIMAHSQLCQAEMLIDSLPESLWEAGWDLRQQHGADLCSWHVDRRLLDLHERREIRAAEAAREAAAALHCTWCRSRGLDSAGHAWQECGRLREFKTKARGRGGRA